MQEKILLQFSNEEEMPEDQETSISTLTIIDFKEAEACENPTKNSKRLHLWRQILAVIPLFIITNVRGLISGYSTILLPQLNKTDTEIIITSEEASWIASITLLAIPIGGFITSISVEILGRKKSHMLSFPIFTTFWLIFMLAQSFEILLTARFLTGIVSGFSMTMTGMYITEISDPKYRGTFLSFAYGATSTGMLLCHIFGTYLNWRFTALVCALMSIPCLFMMFFAPESPQWLIRKGKLKEATQAFYWLRGTTPEVKDELSKLISKVKEDAEREESLKEQLQAFNTAKFWKPFLIVSLIVLTQQWSGYYSLEFYSVTIADMAFDGDEYLITIIIDIVRIVGCIISIFLCKHLNRRPHLMISGVGAAFCLMVFGGLLHFSTQFQIEPLVTLFFLLLYTAFIASGFGILNGVICAEIFPFRMRGLGMAMTTFTMHIFSFGVVKLGPVMFEDLGLVVTFIIYGGACFLGTAVLFFTLPETRGKTLVEIESIFKKPQKEYNK